MKYLKSIIFMSILIFSAIAYGGAVSNTLTKGEFVNLLKGLDEEGRLEGMVTSDSNPLTRGECAKLMIQLLGYQGIAKECESLSLYKDVTTYKGEINAVTQLGLLSGTGNNTFTPNGTLTKEQGQIIMQRLSKGWSKEDGWQHAFYAISSSSQKDYIKACDAVSFGWAELVYDEGKGSFKITTEGKSFRVPSGFQTVVDEAKSNGVETYLMIYFEDYQNRASSFLNSAASRQKVINEITTLANGLSYGEYTRSFDGVTIDFEGFLSENLKEPYVQFLQELKVALKQVNKTLNVAVQPSTYYKGYNYKEIGKLVDHVIVMAHDYGAKKLSAFEMDLGITNTPITPISEVYKTLKEVIGCIEDRSKVVLQISFGSLQWQVQNGKVINSVAYTPSYDKIESRLLDEKVIKAYSEIYQNPYITYEENGVSNMIWYENNRSVQAKLRLSRLLGIGGVSYWRLGTIPNSVLESFNESLAN